ncbi:nitroreductase [Actinoplanes sp. N902-109]|uniref:Acg family FMN-binding oxidoreductase n=1 Tax=Actinoplanes sp. (strain N902-109) TaxID=649831 RepID=UPI0003294904|nr:nitroreductase [Actinoplanes sp. N902-109]AGL16929.1 nitroreductase [Actinoplanes sp. N902-109]
MTARSDRPARSRITAALETAARRSLLAPSVFNTQPWRWRLHDDRLELSADRGRALTVTDPDGRLLLLSCGAALNHAVLTLAALGWVPQVTRMPDGEDAPLLATITVTGTDQVGADSERMADAIPRRRTDRRPFGDRPVPEQTLTRLRRVVEQHGAYLHIVRRDQMPMLATSTGRAADAEREDPAYRAELQQWTHRPAGSGDGVPATTAVQPGPRRVPVRDYAPDGTPGLRPGPGFDLGAAYVVLFGLSDRPVELLRGGEALSALLLMATAEGLATAPLSDTIEVEWPRRLLRDLLAGVGEPYIVVRLGFRATTEDLPPAPRRRAADVIDTSGEHREHGTI